MILFLIFSILAVLLAENWLGHWLLREKLYGTGETITSFSLGITSFVCSIFFSAIPFLSYLYILDNYALFTFEIQNWISWVLAVLAYDFLYYCSHLAHHKIPILWANHLVHHSGEEYNLALAVRIGIFGTFTVWFFYLPMAVIGIPIEIFGAVAVAQSAYQFFLHTKLIPELGKLEYLFVTPSQHRVHHSRNDQYLDRNMGCFFVVWDRLFGTYQRELPELPCDYGLKEPMGSYVPESINLRPLYILVRRAFREERVLGKFLVFFRRKPDLHLGSEIESNEFTKIKTNTVPYLVSNFFSAFLMALIVVSEQNDQPWFILLSLCILVLLSINFLGCVMDGVRLNAHLLAVLNCLMLATFIALFFLVSAGTSIYICATGLVSCLFSLVKIPTIVRHCQSIAA